jgi:hypothetical protein
MRFLTAASGLLLGIAGLSWLLTTSASRLHGTLLPKRLPGAWIEDRSAATWIVLSPRCSHCAAHLRALESCLAALPDRDRRRIVPRLRVIGAPAGLARGLETRPAAWRDSLAVRFVPMTLWVEGRGEVCEAWLGVRRPEVWQRTIRSFLAREGGG